LIVLLNILLSIPLSTINTYKIPILKHNSMISSVFSQIKQNNNYLEKSKEKIYKFPV